MKKLLLSATLIAAVFTSQADELDTTKVHAIDKVVVNSLRTPMLKSDVPNSVEVITPGDISRASATSLSEMVRGFTPSESGDYQGLVGGIELRGFAPSGLGTNTYTLLLVDGIRMGTRYPATTFLTGISSIELLRGPFSAVYGSGAMGGVVNVLTPVSKGAVRGTVGLSYGTWKTDAESVALGGSLGKRWDFDAVFDHSRRAGDYRTGSRNTLHTSPSEKAVWDPHAYDTTYHNTGYDKMRGMLRVGCDLSDRWRLNLCNDVYYTGDAMANGNLWGQYGITDARIMRDFHRLDLTGTAGRHTLRLSPYLSFEERDLDNIGNSYGKNHFSYNTMGILAQDAIRLGFGSLVVGADNFSECFRSSNENTDGSPAAPWQPDYNNVQTGVFAQLNFSFWKGRVSGIAGLRYENIRFRTLHTGLIDSEPNSDDYNTVNPNVSVQFRPMTGLRIHGGVGRAFLAPDPLKSTGKYTSYYTYIGNPALKPESAVTWEAGIGYDSPSGALQTDVTLFFTNHNNLVVSKSIAENTYTFENVSEASMDGLEIMASYDLGTALGKAFSWKFHGSCLRIFHSEVKTADIASERRYVSRTKATFGTTFLHKGLSLDLSGRYAGQNTQDNGVNKDWPFTTSGGLPVRPSTDGQATVRMPDYMVLDASASFRVMHNMTLGVKVNNLLDELYAERDGYYLPGRNFTFSMRLTF